MTAISYPDAHVHPDDGLIDVQPGSFVNAAAESEWEDCLAFAKARDCVPFLGVHPWFIDEATAGWLERLRTLAQAHEIGIGEIGLDRHRGPDLETQLTGFDAQLTIAMELGRPLSIHCVKRWGALVDALNDHLPFSGGVMVHGFNGSADVQNQLLEMGCYLSFGLALLDQNAATAEAWKRTPDHRVFLESDAAPALEKRGRDLADYGTEMALLLSAGAALRGVASDKLAADLRSNTAAFLGNSDFRS